MNQNEAVQKRFREIYQTSRILPGAIHELVIELRKTICPLAQVEASCKKSPKGRIVIISATSNFQFLRGTAKELYPRLYEKHLIETSYCEHESFLE